MGSEIGINSIGGVNNRYLNQALQKGNQASGHLASSLRIAQASDDAAGLGISERMRALIRSFDQASRNTLQGVDLAKTADSALGGASETLGRMRELAVQSSSGTLSDADRATINDEFTQLSDHLDSLGQDTEFNGQKLLDGSTSSVEVQSGVSAGDTTSIQLTELSASALALDTESVDSAAAASSAIAALDSAIEDVSRARGDLGANVHALTSQHSVVSQSSLQLSASESRLRDVDVAYEVAVQSQQQILAKGSVALLSQSFLSASAAGRLL
ncbi:MAG: flagellin [Candidatus Paceibacteria bacterium]|jgi:flagellin